MSKGPRPWLVGGRFRVFGQVKGLRPPRGTVGDATCLVAPGPVSMMLLCMIVKLVKLVDRTEMRKTDCFGKTRLVLHVPSSS